MVDARRLALTCPKPECFSSGTGIGVSPFLHVRLIAPDSD